MDTLQLTIIIVLAILTLNTVAITVSIVLILKEVRELLVKTNRIVDNVHTVTSTISNPIATLIESVTALAGGFTAVRPFNKFKRRNRKMED